MLNSTTNIGIYKGVFTTNDSENRATVEITIPSKTSISSVALRYPTAVITMTTGDVYKAKSTEFAQEGFEINEMPFSSTDLSFKFSVDADGSNPTVSDLTFKGENSSILVSKHTMLAPVMPITGTYMCTVCNGHPGLNSGVEQTFNIIINENTGQIDSQVAFGGSIVLNGIGVQDNCTPNGNFTDCDINSGDGATNVGFMFNGQPITWTGNHSFNNQPSDPSVDCSGINGTWSFVTNNYGTITGTFVSDFSCSDAIIFNEDFQTFTGAGFSPTPAAGQLDSNIFISTGFSDGSVAFGDTQTTGDFARGQSTGGVTTGGVYAFDVDGAGNIAWGVQPGGSDWTPGTFKVKIQNNSGGDLNNFMVSYDIYVNNDQGRANSFNFAYSTDGSSFTNDSALDYTSPGAADSNGFVKVSRNTSIAVTVANGDYLYLEFSGDDVTGGGSRDEFAVDNIVVKAN